MYTYVHFVTNFTFYKPALYSDVPFRRIYRSGVRTHAKRVKFALLDAHTFISTVHDFAFTFTFSPIYLIMMICKNIFTDLSAFILAQEAVSFTPDEMHRELYVLFTQNAQADLHTNLRANPLNTPFDHIHFWRTLVARCSASCVNGASARKPENSGLRSEINTMGAQPIREMDYELITFSKTSFFQKTCS